MLLFEELAGLWYFTPKQGWNHDAASSISAKPVPQRIEVIPYRQSAGVVTDVL